ncbi:MAG TPA: hypothetical protein VKC66_19435 [Xanthobacteraceae bacterium]|nr:hypothetical protein [Xanthobacteraceae bacterium]
MNQVTRFDWQEVDLTDTFLPPIEQPEGLIKKLAHYAPTIRAKCLRR